MTTYIHQEVSLNEQLNKYVKRSLYQQLEIPRHLLNDFKVNADVTPSQELDAYNVAATILFIPVSHVRNLYAKLLSETEQLLTDYEYHQCAYSRFQWFAFTVIWFSLHCLLY